MSEKVGVSQNNPDPFPARAINRPGEYVHLYERPEPETKPEPESKPEPEIEQKIVASAEFMKLLESARSFVSEGWRVVPGSVQCLTEYWKPKSSERVETLSRFVLLMERADEEVQVVDRADFDWYQTSTGGGFIAVKTVLLQAMLTSVIGAWPDWRSWPVGAPGRNEMERQEEVYKSLLRFVMESDK